MRIVVSILLNLLLFSGYAFACLCKEQTVEEALKTSVSVFTGRVLSTGYQLGPEFLVVEIRVSRVWKGPKIDRIEVKTAVSKEDCGFPFEKDKDYLVYAAGGKMLDVSTCSRSASLDKADADIQKLETLVKGFWISSSGTDREPFGTQEGDSKDVHRSAPVPKTLTVTYAVIRGIVKKGTEYIALIRSADGKIYSMKVGDKLYDGVITRIDSQSVTFRQNKNTTVRKTLHPFPE